MTFHEVRFPDDIAYGATGGPAYSTSVVVTASGYEQRNMNWSAARGSWDVSSGLKKPSQLDLLIAFFRARKGKAYGFRFKDWTDYKATGQLLGTGDGATKTFQLVKTYASGAGSETRTITKPVLGTVVPYLGGVKQTSGWSINTATGVLTFTVAPAQGVAVTADFEFDVPVRFDTDSMEATIENFNINEWPSIPIVEIRV
ncbi:MAG: TIGR02217 family protein [Proteobacteria bacterium]|nr:TIGR02217 family protein [Pseudomonadota bacterium]